MIYVIDWMKSNYLTVGLGAYFAALIIISLARRYYSGLTRKMNRQHESDFARDALTEALELTAFARGQRDAQKPPRQIKAA